MSYYDDVQAARATVTDLESKLATARSSLATLEAQAMKGGPDVSQSQGDVDWAKVKAAGYDICFPKISDGDILDPTYSAARVAAIRTAGLNFAPYYFARVASDGNSQRNGRDEAAMAVYFATKQGWGKSGDLPMVYDFENANGQTAAKSARHLMQFLGAYAGLMGHWPIIYTMPAFWATISGALSALDKSTVALCPLWIAHWNVASPSVPAPWTTWTFWQYTDKGSVPGVTGDVDVSRANLRLTDLDSLRIR